MRADEIIKTEIAYLQDPSESPQGVNVHAVTAELLLDIRRILLDMAKTQGADIDRYTDSPKTAEGVQPGADDPGVPEFWSSTAGKG